MSALRRFRTSGIALGSAALLAAMLPAAAQAADDPDPRIGLTPGYFPWSEAASNIELLDNDPRAGAFDGPPGGSSINSDLAFSGDNAIVGNYLGFQVYDVSDPTSPSLRGSFLCPGGQGDVSVYGDLLFVSVEQTSGRIDCGTQGAPGTVNPERFRGIRIFDISDIDNPEQVGGVQTCRGSHTHTLVTDPDDADNVYLYNSGTSSVRSADELAGCENAPTNSNTPVTSGNPTQWRIDVIKVPLAAPEDAAIVSQPRIFTDPATGAFNGLQNLPPNGTHPSGTNYSPSPNTNTCHDITAYPEVGLAAGACQGNGILLDISDPANPVRTDAVADINFSYWHSATINNDGTKVIFTDEWGGGSSPRCRVTDQPEWGADAIFDIVDGKMEFASYYKLPVPQTDQENCVAHNGSLIPVPGRDIMVQAWYQGGLSIFDFTDSSNPVEIAYYDRGPINGAALALGGFWSTYWYNGNVFGSEIARGFDAFELLPSDLVSAHEIGAAKEASVDELNAQHQTTLTWSPSFNVAGSYVDQAERSGALTSDPLQGVRDNLALAQANTASAPLVRHYLNAALRFLGTNGDQGKARQAIVDLRDSTQCSADCKLPTKVTASHSPEPSTAGEASTAKVTVERVGTEGADPAGTVRVTDASGKQLGTATLVKGSASVDLPADLPAGTHVLTATYGGDQMNAVSSATFTATVKAAPEPPTTEPVPSRTSVKVKPAEPRFKKAFDVVVKVRATGADATGKVVVKVDGKKVATRKLADGRVVVTIRKTFAPGKHTLVATYEGSKAAQASKARTTFRVVR